MTELWHPTVPSFDCIARGHLWMEQRIGQAHGSWCPWCGSGVTNEHEPEAISDWRLIYGADWESARCDYPPCRLCFPEES